MAFDKFRTTRSAPPPLKESIIKHKFFIININGFSTKLVVVEANGAHPSLPL